ncbi:hypothetical protein VDG1235_823 [Verrucomicrobiia bacterium DG1235]|nr:hypothetical protein VDG1235_823 [Verrucomicrobiae bacterium DG1235]
MKTPALFILSLLSLDLAIAEPNTSSKTKKPRQTMAHSIVSPSYQREQLPNGGWKPETYALAIGKKLDPTERDSSLESLTVDEMAETLANALHHQNYLPETDPQNTDLMIVVNWGKTIPFNNGLKQQSLDRLSSTFNQIDGLEINSDNAGEITLSATQSEMQLENMLTIQSMAERARRQANDYNAQLLGFAPDLVDHYTSETLGGPQRMIYDELVEEVEASRYFVILVAYDFHKLVDKKEKDILWITRFSMRAKGRQFDEELANMANSASRFFGKNSGKMRGSLLPGQIKMGELEVIDSADEISDIE